MSLGLTVPIKGDAGDLDKTLKGASGSVMGFGGDVAGAVSKVLPMAAAATGAAVAIAEMTNAAADDRAEQAKLEQTIASATRSTADYTAEVDAAIAAGQERAFTDSETRDALASLVTATGDVDAATYQLAQAQDIARLAGVDLATAADAIAKADQGQDAQLRKLIPGLEKGTTATDTLANASRAAAGQADLFAASSEGMGIKAKDAFAEIGEQIGAVFLPILDALLPALLPILSAFSELISAILPILIPLINVLGVALTKVATVISTVVGWLVKLIGWLKQAIDLVGDLLGKIPGLDRVAGIVGSIGGNATVAATGPSAYGATTRSGGSSAPTTVVFNTYTTGDSLATEAAIARAVRRVLRINAGRPSWST